LDDQYLQAGATPEFFYFKAKPELIRVLVARIGAKERVSILDVGAGTGEELSVLSRFGEVTVLESDEQMLKRVPNHLVKEKHLGSVVTLKFPDNGFDLVAAFDVLEHIDNDREAVRQMVRVLKGGGHLILTVPALSRLYGAHDQALGHYRRYDRKDLLNLIPGLDCLEVGYWVCFLFLPVALQRWCKRRSANPRVHFMRLPRWFNQL
jgi:ubiquinone/menaquinone biosynthesis C-methylase UbiE